MPSPLPTTLSGRIDWGFLTYERRTKILDGQMLHRCLDCRLYFNRSEFAPCELNVGGISHLCRVCQDRLGERSA